MFCQNCGTKMQENAKFCPSCGTQVAQKQEQPKQEAPRQFGYNNSLQEGGGAQYQKTAFKGKQFSAGTSGGVQFNREPKKRGLLGRLIRLGVIGAVVLVAYFIFFGDSGPVYDVEFGTGIDLNAGELTGVDSTFPVGTSEVFIMYSTQDLEIGTTIFIYWYDLENSADTPAVSQSYTTTAELNSAYNSVTSTGGFLAGDYEVDFVIDGEVVKTASFTIE